LKKQDEEEKKNATEISADKDAVSAAKKQAKENEYVCAIHLSTA
jgi:hypothetical protein